MSRSTPLSDKGKKLLLQLLQHRGPMTSTQIHCVCNGLITVCVINSTLQFFEEKGLTIKQIVPATNRSNQKTLWKIAPNAQNQIEAIDAIETPTAPPPLKPHTKPSYHKGVYTPSKWINPREESEQCRQYKSHGMPC